MKKSRFILLLSIITTTCLLPVGKADWSALKKSKTLVASSSTAVCYIGSTKFTTLDDALYYAEANNTNDKIYVIPGLNAELKIEKSHTINEGDALFLPYDTPDTDDDKIASSTGSDYSGFADNIASNRKTLVTLGANVELTIDGTLSIGAITGSKSWKKPMGQASSSYCEIKMGNSSKLIVNGELDCYGFIKDSDNGNSQITVNGTIKTPVVFYDFNGGTEAKNLYSNGVFPLKQYDIPQIRPKMTFSFGSSLIGTARIYANKEYYTVEASLLGKSNSFINMGEGSAIDWQYVDSGSRSTSDEFTKHSTNISVLKGSLEFGSLSITLIFEIDSSKFYLPIPCGYSIVIKSGSEFTLPNTIKGVKFMPDSSLECEYGATVNLNSNVLFYQNRTSEDDNKFVYPSENPAVCLNDGTMVINAGFEGVIATSSNKSGEAKLEFGKSYSLISDNKEDTSSERYYWNGAVGKISQSIQSTDVTDACFIQNSNYSSYNGNDFWVGESGTMFRDIDDVVVKTKDGNDVGKEISYHSNDGDTVECVNSSLNLEAIIRPVRHSDVAAITYSWRLSGLSATKNKKKIYIRFNNDDGAGQLSANEKTYTSSNANVRVTTSMDDGFTATTDSSFKLFVKVNYQITQGGDTFQIPYKIVNSKRYGFEVTIKVVAYKTASA